MRRGAIVLTGLVLLGAAAMLSGCARNTTSNVAEIRTGDGGAMIDQRVIINHKGFGKRVFVQGMDVRKAGEILQARVVLQNQRKKTIPFVYKFDWYGSDGFPIDTGTSVWKNDSLKGMEMKNVIGTAPSARAVDVRLHIRQVKN